MRQSAIRPVVAIPIWLALGASCDPTELAPRASAVTRPDALSGAIFTTLVDGARVNANIYPAKEDVYLDGGPGPNAPVSAAGLPSGDYYFQVTDPSGKDLLSTDHISCRRVHVNAAGVIDTVHAGVTYQRSHGTWVAAPCRHNQGIDIDHAADGAITVQLMPYDDTPNPGGVYKAWMTRVEDYIGDAAFVPTHARDAVNGEGYAPGNYHGFAPSQSKTDNYKVRKPGKPFVPPVLTVRKFHDRDLDGALDTGEELVAGWLVAISDPLGASNNYYTEVSVYASTGTWTVAEDQPPSTTQTAVYVDGLGVPLSPVVEVVFAGTSDERHDVLFGNAGTGNITACKGYDRDADGVIVDEPMIAGWQIAMSGVTLRGDTLGPIVQLTGDGGCTRFGGLLPGTYTITEQLPSSGGWVATSTTTQIVTITSTLTGTVIAGTSTSATFTNRCLGAADFGTKGYWHNKNGIDELTADDIAHVNGLAPYTAPSSYFDAGDEPFDGAFSDGSPVAAAMGAIGMIAPGGSAFAEVSSFLVDANATGDPREQLAQQLLAFIFNVRHRLDGADAMIVLPGGDEMSAATLVSGAILAWLSNDPDAQHWWEALLDVLNNSDALPFVHATPCPVSYP